MSKAEESQAIHEKKQHWKLTDEIFKSSGSK